MTQPKNNQEWKKSRDYEYAIEYANRLLDAPYADPDDDIRTLARQFLRMIERYDKQKSDFIKEVEGMKLKSLPKEKEMEWVNDLKIVYNQVLDDILSKLKEKK